MPATRVFVAVLFIAAVSAGICGEGDPDPAALDEMFSLSARKTKVQLELDFINKRLATLEKEQFAKFTRVADPTGTEYWESISDNVLSARASRDIAKGELLLYHAPGIYRVHEVKPKLTTKGECWYFRPDRDIRKGLEFSIELIHDAPEELKNVAAGFAPHSDRARDPERAYKTKIHAAR